MRKVKSVRKQTFGAHPTEAVWKEGGIQKRSNTMWPPYGVGFQMSQLEFDGGEETGNTKASC